MRQACSARRRRSGCSCRARALPSWLMKSWDSRDQRPPTSTPNTTSRLCSGTHQLRATSLFPTSSCLQSDSRCVCCSWYRRPVTAQCTHDCSVHCKLGSAKQRKPINHDLQPPAICFVHQRCPTRGGERLPPHDIPLASTLSRGNSLLPRIPARAQAARWSECPKCGGMISTYITQVPGVAVHVLHGEP